MSLVSQLRPFELGLIIGQNVQRYDAERRGRPWTAAQRMIKINQCRSVDFIQTPTSRLTTRDNGLKLLGEGSGDGWRSAVKTPFTIREVTGSNRKTVIPAERTGG